MACRTSRARTIGVTGATGCIGGMVVRHLADTPSVRVLALVRGGTSRVGRGVEVRRGDLFGRDALRRLVADSDAILHLAARNPSSPTQDQREMTDFFATNSCGTGAVAHLARAYDRPLIYTSTVTVYEMGQKGSGPLEEDEPLPARRKTGAWVERALEGSGGVIRAWAYGEIENPGREVGAFLREDPPPSENIYGLSKLLGERWVAPTAKGLVLRLSDVYGPGHEARGILQEYLDRLLTGSQVSVDFGPRARISFVYLGDVLRAFLRSLAEAKALTGSVINVAHPASVSPKQLRDVLLTVGGQGSVGVRGAGEPLYPGSERPFATGRAERLLGARWTPLAEGVHETLRYLRMPAADRWAYRFPELGL